MSFSRPAVSKSFPWLPLAAGALLLLLALHLFRETPYLWLNAIIASVGVVFAAAGAWGLLRGTWPVWLEPGLARVAAWVDVRADRLVLALLGLLLSAAARSAAGDGSLVHSPTAAPLWVAGITLVVVGLGRKQDRPGSRRWPLWEILLVIALGLGSLWLRAWRAESWPHVLSGDEGSVGMTAWEFRAGQRDNLLSLGWWSFPALYFWLVSLSQAVFGRTVEAIRWVSALGGAPTVVALYAAARSMFGRPVAIWSALWLSGFHHHLFFSRVAYNNIWDGLFFIVAAGSIWHGWNRGRRSAYLWAGLALGLGQYFYTTSHLALLVLGIWLILLHRPRRASPDPAPRGGWPDVACLALVTVAAVLPLALLYLEHPESLVYTSERVTLFPPGWEQVAETLGLTPLGLVLEQMGVTALGFVVAELEGVYYAPGVPLLFSLSALFFVVGLIICLLHLRDPRYVLPLLTLAGTVVVGGLSIQAPNGQRMMLLPPMLALMVALPLSRHGCGSAGLGRSRIGPWWRAAPAWWW
ncbi:MAG: glycosyltransferase family 39 protein [Chloroflexota bacterium]